MVVASLEEKEEEEEKRIRDDRAMKANGEMWSPWLCKKKKKKEKKKKEKEIVQ